MRSNYKGPPKRELDLEFISNFCFEKLIQGQVKTEKFRLIAILVCVSTN